MDLVELSGAGWNYVDCFKIAFSLTTTRGYTTTDEILYLLGIDPKTLKSSEGRAFERYKTKIRDLGFDIRTLDYRHRETLYYLDHITKPKHAKPPRLFRCWWLLKWACLRDHIFDVPTLKHLFRLDNTRLKTDLTVLAMSGFWECQPHQMIEYEIENKQLRLIVPDTLKQNIKRLYR